MPNRYPELAPNYSIIMVHSAMPDVVHAAYLSTPSEMRALREFAMVYEKASAAQLADMEDCA